MNSTAYNNRGASATRSGWWTLAFALAMFWLVMVEGRLDGWWYALPVVALAWWIRRRLPLPLFLGGIRLTALLWIVPLFIRDSLIGGVDVARRALHPACPLDPHLYRYEFHVQSLGARVFLAQMISLMPGTLACTVGDKEMLVHALAGSRDEVMGGVVRVERRVAALFGETWEGPT